MEKKYVIGIDQGTTSTKAVLLDRGGHRLALARSAKHTFHYPQDGFVEQDAAEIYDATCGVIRSVMEQAHAAPGEIACISFSIQTSPLVFWDPKTALPIYPMIGWQCTRGREVVRKMDPDFRRYIADKTGFEVEGASDSAKLLWIFEHEPELRGRILSGQVLWGTIESYIIWRMTCGKSYGMEMGNANSAGLADGETIEWAEDRILQAFGLEPKMMPALTTSDAVFGEATEPGMEGILLCSAMWDGYAALYSHRDYRMGDAKCSYGTGAHIAIDVGDQAGQKEKSYKLGAFYEGRAHRMLHGNVLYAGATMQWVCESIGLLDKVGDADRVAETVENCGGVYLVPAFSGIAAPYFDSDARAAFMGMTRATTRAHLVRAALESTAYQIKDIMDDIYSRHGHMPKRLFADGGASSSAFLMQFQADLLGFDVVCEDIDEAAAVGVAYFGGYHTGFFSDLSALEDLGERKAVYHPQMPLSQRDELVAGWKAAVARTLSAK